MPEIDYPLDKNMGAHYLTIPRELTLEGNTLKQKPVEELILFNNIYINKGLNLSHLKIQACICCNYS
ncbi:sucrose-6-phosphate hydrolase (Sucrase) [Clostridium cellulovorans]|uniref:sucrose-6-phosphate hydrolase (Sucrase) n=1 Tax=Clostridium cellulovorans TaxID=1493 RepID=UPI0001A96A5A|nr:sucrose-6-phosphate hydrolase (Sucrase) [Clostridium cellulovorans]